MTWRHPQAGPSPFSMSSQQFEQRLGDMDKYASKVSTEGGFSVNLPTGRTPTKGYMVAEHGAEVTHPGEPTGDDLRNFSRQHKSRLEGGNAYLGAWKSGDETYLDVSRNVPNRAFADRLGVEHAQRAIYDVETGKDPLVRGHSKKLQHKGTLLEGFSGTEQRHLGRANQEAGRARRDRFLTATSWNEQNEPKPKPSTARQTQLF